MQPEPSTQFPKKVDESRLSDYDHYDKLYFGDHYSAFAIKAKKGFPEQYARLRYVVANFPGLISRVVADMLFGEGIVIDVKDDNTQKWIDGLIDDTHLLAQLYESALANSRRGDSIFKIRLEYDDEKPEICIEEVSPAIYFPELDTNYARMRAKRDVLCWTFKSDDGKTVYLQKEIHERGKILNEVYTYDENAKKIIAQLTDQEMKSQFGLDPTVDTKINHSLVFHIPNVRDGSSFFGTSDYKDLEQLFFALNNRITKVDNILDKHSDPILAVPPGVMDEKGNVKKERLGMFEVDNESPGFNKPEYIVWNANLESAFSEIDKLVEFLFMFSEISPATMGMDKAGGQIESGRALKLKLLRTIAKRNRKKIYYDIAIKEMLEVAQEFGKAWNVEIDGVKISDTQKPDIKWSDGVIPDMTGQIEDEVKRLDAGLSSTADSIARIDNMKPEQAREKAKEIEQENTITVPTIPAGK